MVLRTTPIFSQKIGKESPKIVIITLTPGHPAGRPLRGRRGRGGGLSRLLPALGRGGQAHCPRGPTARLQCQAGGRQFGVNHLKQCKLVVSFLSFFIFTSLPCF
jgi:hypothetical protein